MESIFSQIINHFDFAYMLIINLVTYFIIKCIDYFNGPIAVPTIGKRILLIASIIIVTCVYISIGYDNKIILFNSAIASPIAWSWILRPIFIKMGFGYKQNRF